MRRNPIFADIFSVLTPSHDSDSDQLTSVCAPPLSSPPFLSAATAALLLYDPNGHHAPCNAACLLLLTSAPPFLSSYSAPFLQTTMIVVLAIHLPKDSYPRQTSMPPSL
ncbi:hypothetical protein B0H14DRAFT_3516007 [Mycena olivaceomarginata]|nr:hypothetical protein B0H14DRAFT_3516007 [Mycena olivaceomarginata]